jgi:hypothetical protein
MTKKLFSVQSLLWLALVLALVGSLRHVAWGFSTLEQGDLIAGYVQAVAVDIGLFALAIGIQQRRRESRGTLNLWFGVVLFSGVSTYANLLHGLVFQSDIGLATWAWLVAMRPFILSAVLPLLVVYLSEVAASDYQHGVKVAEKEQRKRERESFGTTGFQATPEAAERARAARLEGKENAKAALVDYLADNPNTTLSRAGQHIGRSKTTVSNYLDELEAAGVVERNGQGVKVL